MGNLIDLYIITILLELISVITFVFLFIMIFFSLQQHVDVIISHYGIFDKFDLNTGKQILLSTGGEPAYSEKGLSGWSHQMCPAWKRRLWSSHYFFLLLSLLYSLQEVGLSVLQICFIA